MKVVVQLPFPDKYDELMEVLLGCHRAAARANNNASSAAFVNSYYGSGQLASAISSALLTTGGAHAPLRGARKIYELANVERIKGLRELNLKVEGFGNSFYKNQIDPSFAPVASHLAKEHPEAWNRISLLQRWVNLVYQKTLYPNAAMFTAACCVVAGVPEGRELSLFLLGRLPAWLEMLPP